MFFHKSRYGKKLIHAVRDRYGVIEVVESSLYRSLHFGTSAQQSCMSIREPQRLVLEYQRFMCAALCFLPQPQRVLSLGLGGGSLPRFIHHHFPKCTVDTVELRPQVAQVARAFFDFGPDERLRVHIADCLDYLKADRAYPCDLIFIDVFTPSGPSPVLQNEQTLYNCAKLLRERGLLVVNLWSHNASPIIDRLKSLLGYSVLRLDCQESGNVIAIAAAQPATLSMERQNRDESPYHNAVDLRDRTRLDLVSIYHQLHSSNAALSSLRSTWGALDHH